ncbi:MAG TPA: DUF6754 domain-containing protein [Bellilinea sp.]|nr:DUF6754 domain-containing protein [Bellilinea sp.]
MISLTGVLGLGVVFLTIALIIILRMLGKDREKPAFRRIAAFDDLKKSIGLAVENGSRIHVTLGKSSLTQPTNTSALAGLSTLDRIAQISSSSDKPPVATSGDGGLTLLSQDTLRSAYRNVHAPELYDPGRGRLTGITPMSYIAGTLHVTTHEDVSAHVMIGNFGPEIALVAEAAEHAGAFSLAASDSLPAQAALFAVAEKPIIGEELFAAPTYLGASRSHSASLQVQDILRWGVIVVLIGGALLKAMGML